MGKTRVGKGVCSRSQAMSLPVMCRSIRNLLWLRDQLDCRPNQIYTCVLWRVPDTRPSGRSVPDGYAMLMRPNKAETAVHGCHCPGDMAVRMRTVLARTWVGVRVYHLL